jgi:hypothetical protein
MVRAWQRPDKLPLNKSFDTAETSDSLFSEDYMFPKQPIVIALGTGDEKESFDTAETSSSLYSEDMFSKQPIFMALGIDEKDESQDPVGKIQEEQDEEAMSDKSLLSSVYTGGEGTIVEPEQDCTSLTRSGHSDETKVAVTSAVSLKFNSDEDVDDISSSALWDAAVTAAIVSGSKWKEDKPFDEEFILEEGAGESVVLEFREYPNESLDEVIESTMFSDNAGRHAESFKAAASVKERKRRRMALLSLLCCLLVIIAVAIGSIVGKFRNNKQTGDASTVSGLQGSPEDPIGEEDEPDREEDDEEELKEKLTTTPSTAAPNPNSTSTSFTSPPSMEPSTGTPSTTMAPSDLPTASPTTPEPTASPTSSPSSQPSDLPTASPTTLEPTASPASSPSSQPSDLPTASPTTLEPTASPTSSPQPTPCTNQIYVDQSCYVQGEAVVTIDFSQCSPQRDDWIGIYIDGANPQTLGDSYVDWSWACGSQSCSGTAERNTFTFNSANFARQSYRAFLIRNSRSPYASIATGDVFTIAQNCPA